MSKRNKGQKRLASAVKKAQGLQAQRAYRVLGRMALTVSGLASYTEDMKILGKFFG